MLISDWTETYDQGFETDVVYLNFSKAFDSVPHKRLIHKLSSMGIRGKFLRWITSFLSNRRQRVVLRNGISKWLPVISGVPQGSILGPILFFLYMNDLPNEITSSLKMFADDTKLYRTVTVEQDCENLQRDLNRLAALLVQNLVVEI